MAQSKMYGLQIRKENGYDANSFTYYPVVVIGAGESGIAMGCQLREQLGFDQFRIFDRQAGIGGTWWINRYPGVACDIPAVFYSFSFCQNPNWDSVYPSGPQIVKYLGEVCEKYEIVDKIQLNTEITECRWIEQEQIWEVTLQHMTPGSGDLSVNDRLAKIKEHGTSSVYIQTETIRTKVLISAVGGLVEPRSWPANITGKDKFEGEIFHSARWKYDVDLTDKDVIVVGTGCSAAQFMPKLVKAPFNAKSVTQLMRSPPWVCPKVEAPGGDEKWAQRGPWLSNNIPGFMRFMRFIVFAGTEHGWRLFGSDPYHEKERKKVEEEMVARLKRMAPTKYHEILTPNYGIGCKRRIFDEAWYPSLQDPRVELTTLPLTSLQERSVTLGPGRLYPDPKNTESKAPSHEVNIPADVIILANGFDVTKWLHPVKVVGRNGQDLQDVMEERGGPQMYMGLAMDNFPNFFTIFGPNTATGHSSVIMASENMVNLTVKIIRPILKGDATIAEIKKQAEIDWATDIQRALAKTVWSTGGCLSWYRTENGWNSTLYPYSQAWFTFCCMFPAWRHWNIKYTRFGLFKKIASAALKYLSCLALITGVWQLKKLGVTLENFPDLFKLVLRMYLLRASRSLKKLSGRI